MAKQIQWGLPKFVDLNISFMKPGFESWGIQISTLKITDISRYRPGSLFNTLFAAPYLVHPPDTTGQFDIHIDNIVTIFLQLLLLFYLGAQLLLLTVHFLYKRSKRKRRRLTKNTRLTLRKQQDVDKRFHICQNCMIPFVSSFRNPTNQSSRGSSSSIRSFLADLTWYTRVSLILQYVTSICILS